MGTVVVTVVGALDDEGSEQFATVVRDLVENQGNLSVEVDLGQVTAMEATGLEALIEAASHIGGRGGQLLVRDGSGHATTGERRHPSPLRPPAHSWGVHRVLRAPAPSTPTSRRGRAQGGEARS